MGKENESWNLGLVLCVIVNRTVVSFLAFVILFSKRKPSVTQARLGPDKLSPSSEAEAGAGRGAGLAGRRAHPSGCWLCLSEGSLHRQILSLRLRGHFSPWRNCGEQSLSPCEGVWAGSLDVQPALLSPKPLLGGPSPTCPPTRPGIPGWEVGLRAGQNLLSADPRGCEAGLSVRLVLRGA